MERLHLPAAAVLALCLSGTQLDAAPVSWGIDSPSTGLLDATKLTISGVYRYTAVGGVNGQGYDVEVTTSGLAEVGAGVFTPTALPAARPGIDTTAPGTNTFFFSAPHTNPINNLAPPNPHRSFGLVQFRFYETDTNNPFSLTGLDFRLEDIDAGERVRAFSYFNPQGTPVSFAGGTAGQNDPFLSYGTGTPQVYQTVPSFDTGAPNQSMSQHGRWIRVNTGATALSGFSFQIAREFNSVLGPEMTGLGNLVPGMQQIAGGAPIPVGHSYGGLTTSQGSTQGTVLRLLDGIASGATEVDAFFTPLGNFSLSDPIYSDVLDLSGTGTDKFVLELSYDPLLLPMGFDETTLYLAWFDGVTFVNAVHGNTGLSTPLFAGDGAYDPSTDYNLGTYGVDTATHRVWAVINHNSEFAAAPEPGATLLLVCGLGALCARRRRSA